MQAQNVLLVGFPNSGKSTLFNKLTKSNQKVSNYSGITVGVRQGKLIEESSNIQIVDLPGIYSLSASSFDEAVTLKALASFESEPYHQVAVIVDAQRMEASLALALQLKRLYGENLILIVNKNDYDETTQQVLKMVKKEFEGVDIHCISALNDSAESLTEIFSRYHSLNKIQPKESIKITPSARELLGEDCPNSIEVVSSDYVIQSIQKSNLESRKLIQKAMDSFGSTTRKIDKMILHPVLGGFIFCFIFYFIFYLLFTGAEPFMEMIEAAFSSISEWIGGFIPEGNIKSLVLDGIIGGVGGVLVFVPQIFFLFFLLSLMEQSGYVSRAAVVADKMMSLFGLSGRAFLPYMSGFACSIPGIMATRTIEDRKERMATLMTLPMITCAARLPVYVLLIGTFVPAVTIGGIFNAQALSFFFLYFLGTFFALIMAKVFRLSFYKGKSDHFVIDLPRYQIPSLKTAFENAWAKAWSFIKKAGTVIFVLSIVIWFLSTYPKPSVQTVEGLSEEKQASIALEHSFLGIVGKTIEPALKPLGMDWKMGVGLLVAQGARELFVSTMGTLYALGDVDEESDSLRERLINEKNPETGKPVFSLAVAWSLLIFFVFSLQCTATLGVLRKETGGWKIPLFMFSYMGFLAYMGSFIAFNLLK